MSGEKPLLPIDIRQHTSGKEQPAAVVIVVIRVARAEAGLTDKAGGMDEGVEKIIKEVASSVARHYIVKE